MALSFTKASAIAVIAIAASSVGTGAFARPDVTRMTCEQAQRFVRQNSPVVVTTGRHTYDMLMGDAYQCSYPYEGRATVVRTRDGVRCAVGYTCVPGADPMWQGGLMDWRQ